MPELPGYPPASVLFSACIFLHHRGTLRNTGKRWKFIAKARNVDVVFLVRRLALAGRNGRISIPSLSPFDFDEP